MIPHIEHGDTMYGLVSYLAGPGKTDEHEDQHVIAASQGIEAEHLGKPLGVEDAAPLARALERSKRLHGRAPTGGHVYHASLSVRAEDGPMSDEKWAELARGFLVKAGYLGQDGKPDAPYVVVRHGLSKEGNDHVHIAASRIRPDGSVVPRYMDLRIAQRACRELEVEHDLPTKLLPGAGARMDRPGELESGQRRGHDVAEWQVAARAVRAAAAASSTEAEFVERLRAAPDVLVRPRLEDGRATGYSVAVKPPEGAKPVFYPGSKLGNDLGLNVVRTGFKTVDDEQAREQWAAAKAGAPAEPKPVTRDEYQAAVVELRALRKRLEVTPPGDVETLRRAAAFTSGAWAAWAQQDESRRADLNGASDQLGRLAQVSRSNYRPGVSQGPVAPTAGRVVGAIGTVPESQRGPLFAELSKVSNTVVAKAIQRGDKVKGGAAMRVVGPQLARAAGGLVMAAQQSLHSALGADMDDEFTPRHGHSMSR